MGCSFCENLIPVDKELKEIFQKLDKRYQEVFGKDGDENKDDNEEENTDLEGQLKIRKEKLTKLQQENKEITEEILKELNEEEKKLKQIYWLKKLIKCIRFMKQVQNQLSQ